VPQLLAVVAPAFACGALSRRLQPPALPVRAFGAEVNYLLALAHHVARANAAAAAAAADSTDADLTPPSPTSHHALQQQHTCAVMQDSAATSVFRGGWFQLPSSIDAAAATPSFSFSSADNASLQPLDFWCILMLLLHCIYVTS
jgi:hypothetical protein